MSHIAIILQETSPELVKALAKFLSIYTLSQPNNLYSIISHLEDSLPLSNYQLPLKPKIIQQQTLVKSLQSSIELLPQAVFLSLQILGQSPSTFSKQLFIFTSKPLIPSPLLTNSVFQASFSHIKISIFSQNKSDSHSICRLTGGSFVLIVNDALELQLLDSYTGNYRSNFDVRNQTLTCEKCAQKVVLGVFCSNCASQFCTKCKEQICPTCKILWK